MSDEELQKVADGEYNPIDGDDSIVDLDEVCAALYRFFGWDPKNCYD